MHPHKATRTDIGNTCVRFACVRKSAPPGRRVPDAAAQRSSRQPPPPHDVRCAMRDARCGGRLADSAGQVTDRGASPTRRYSTSQRAKRGRSRRSLSWHTWAAHASCTPECSQRARPRPRPRPLACPGVPCPGVQACKSLGGPGAGAHSFWKPASTSVCRSMCSARRRAHRGGSSEKSSGDLRNKERIRENINGEKTR